MVLVAVVPAGPTLIEQWKHIRFQEWVLDHWDEIESGTANLEGQKVGRGTVLACYPLISSAVVIQLRSPGRPVLRGTASAARARWTSIFVAAVGGWWCLPDGPLATIGVLRRGFRDEPVLVTLEDVAGAILNGKRLGNVSLDS